MRITIWAGYSGRGARCWAHTARCLGEAINMMALDLHGRGKPYVRGSIGR